MSLTLTETEYRALMDKLPGNDLVAPPKKVVAAVARIVATAYKSKLEARWAGIGPGIVGEIMGAAVVETKYEPFSLNISGGSYTPDFMHILIDGRIVIVETKGNIRMRNARDSRSKFRAAANDFSIFYFVWVEMIPKSHSLKIELFDPFTNAGKTVTWEG